MKKQYCAVFVLILLYVETSLAQCCSNGVNLLANYNPDFSISGNPMPPGFTTDNIYSEVLSAGYYSVIVSRNYGACLFTPQYDHTSGDTTGRYLWFDTAFGASESSPQIAWRPFNPLLPEEDQYAVSVSPNTTYVFSVWVRDLAREPDCINGGAPLMGLRINGVDMGEVDLSIPTDSCCPPWVYLCAEWNSEDTTKAFIQIESRTDIGWTDLGIDDVFFGSTFPFQQGVLGPDQVVCSNDTIVLSPEITYGNISWSDGSSGDSLIVTSSGLYWIEVDQDGCNGLDSILISIGEDDLAVSAGPDLTICQGATGILNASSFSAGNYSWSNGAQSSTTSVTAPGLYWVQFENECGLAQDTVMVNVLPLEITLESTSISCSTQVANVNANNNFENQVDYAWTTSTGQILGNNTEDQISVAAPGWYTLTSSIDGECERIDSIEVLDISAPIQVEIIEPVEINCYDPAPEILTTTNASMPQFTWYFNNQFVGNQGTVNASAPGNYVIQIFDALTQCTGADTVEVNANILPPSISIPPPDTLSCLRPQITIGEIEITPSANYLSNWSTDSGNFVSDPEDLWVTVDSEGMYVLSIVSEENGCLAEDSIFVYANNEISFDPSSLTFPDIISPNGDGENEYWRPFLSALPSLNVSDYITDYSLRIFNRWGNEVFFSNTSSAYWRAQDLSEGVYYYTIEFNTICTQTTQVSKSGSITVIR